MVLQNKRLEEGDPKGTLPETNIVPENWPFQKELQASQLWTKTFATTRDPQMVSTEWPRAL